MAVQHGIHFGRIGHRPARSAGAATTGAITARVGVREAVVATVRIGTGFVFLWAFLDKTFGLHYSTPSAKAWIHGGSPTKGFLASVNVGPFQSWYNAWAGHTWADYLFMIGLAGIGTALILGIGVRIAAACGILLVAFMWFAVFPIAQHAADGSLTDSTNPLIDDHIMDAFALATIAAFGTGSRLGLGAWWTTLPLIRDHHELH